MKLHVEIDKNKEEEILIRVHEHSKLVTAICDLVNETAFDLMGQKDGTYEKIDLARVQYFQSEDNKVYAVMEKDRLQLRQRLYQLEEVLPSHFVRLNQSCIANLKKIKKFDASIGGTMRVIFQNGDTDYVSRRQLKAVKERIGI